MVVLNAFKETISGFEKEYLEKIIQVPFEIPALIESDIEKMFFDQVRSVLELFDFSLYEESKLINVYKFGLRYYFKNIRDISRFFNTLSFNARLVGKEVNPVDFISIIAFQVFSPTFYYAVRDNIDLFTEQTEPFDGFLDDKKNVRKERLDALLKLDNIIPKDRFIEMLTKIFPTITTYLSNNKLNSDEFSTLRRAGCVCISENFYNYFKLSISEYDITREEIVNILSGAVSFEKFVESLNKLKAQGRIVKFLDRFLDYVNDNKLIPESRISIILSGLLDQADSFPEASTGYIVVKSTSERIILIISELLKRVNSQDERYEILFECFSHTSNSLYILAFELSQRINEIEKQDYLLRDEPIINENHILKLKQIMCNKFEEWQKSGKLFNHKELVYLLYRWRNWCDEKLVKNFIKKNTASDENLLLFLSKFLYTTSQYDYRDYAGKQSSKLNVKELKDFLEFANLSTRIYKLSKSQIYKSLDEKERLPIDLFLKFIENKIVEPT